MSVFWSMTVYIFAMAFTPGPNCILSMINAAQKGFPKCLSLNFGMYTGGIVLHLIGYVMVFVLASLVPVIKPVLQILGVLYILYLAWCIYKSGEVKCTKQGGDFKTGFVLQFMNVKAMLLGITTATTYILPQNYSFLFGYLFIVYTDFMCILSTVTWAVCGSALSDSYSKHRKAYNTFFALTLVILAVSSFF